MKTPSGRRVVLALLPFAAAMLGATKARAEEVRLRPGCVELGAAGALAQVEGSTQGQILLRSGPFVAAGPGLAGLQGEVGYTHQRDLDRFDLQGAVSWQRSLWRPELLPFLAIAGGVQVEWLGSFRTTRFPLGVDAGVRTLLGNLAGLRLEYRFRRVLDDPVADYDEHRLVFGVSLFLNNRPSS